MTSILPPGSLESATSAPILNRYPTDAELDAQFAEERAMVDAELVRYAAAVEAAGQVLIAAEVPTPDYDELGVHEPLDY